MLLYALQFGPELVVVVGETVSRIKQKVKTARHGFVARTDARQDCSQRGCHLCGVGGLQVIVHKNDQRQRETFRRENIDRLLHAVVEYSKLLVLKVSD